MKILILLLLISCPLTSYASQLVPHYLPLNDISCALLVTISSYTVKTNLLKGAVKRTWGTCMGKGSEWILWAPVEWKDPEVSPIEVSFHEASRRRDFKADEEIILIRGQGWETFEPTPEMFEKLEYIFHPKAYLENILKTADENKLAELLADPVSQGELFKLLVSAKKMTPALALKAHIQSQKRYSQDFANLYLTTLPSPEKLKFIDAISKSDDYKKLDQGPYRLFDLLSYSLGEEKFPAMKVAVTNMSPEIEAQNEFRAKFYFNEGKNYLALQSPERKWFVAEWMRTVQGKVTTSYGNQIFGMWESFTPDEKKALFPAMVTMLFKNLTVKEAFYDRYVYRLITDEFPDFWKAPRYLELIENVWTDERFFNDDSSEDYILFEKILKEAQKNKDFVPVLKKFNDVAKMNKKKYPFQGEVDKILSHP